MSERGGHENYIYSPRSLVYNELCMIIATKYFRLVPTGRDGGGGPGSSKSRKSKNGSGKASGGSGGIPAGEKALFASIVEEVTEREYNSRRTPWEKSYPYTPRDVVVARIITFGPVGARGSNVSLWFDINPSDIVPCTPPMIKRYKRNKLRLQQAQQQQQGRQCSVSKSIVPGCFPPYPFMEGTAGSGGGGGSGGPVPSFKCPHHRPFFYVHTGDEGGGGGDRSSSSSAVALVRRIMMHRLRALRTRDRLQGRAFATEWNRLSSEETELKGDFERLRQRTEDGTWPVNVGREIPVDDETPVPRCGGRYRIDGRGKYGDSANFKIWESFTGTMVGKDMHHEGESNGSRLSVFQRLANGQAVDRSESTMLPHIGKPPPTRDGAEAPAAPHVPRKTRELWKELLLLDDDDDESDRSEGEWAKLLELHSENTEDLTSPAAAADPSLSDSPLGGGAAVAGTGASGEGGRLCSPSKPNRRRDHDMPLSSPMSGGVNNNAGGGNSPGGGGSSLNSHNKRAAINAAAASTRLVRLPSF
uniref:Uncharacterized protein n=2 Tax=Odontella aurita TaxID=265563 RepID=A0A7S4MQU8_9STRA|mmetsp:Transcript_29243/g.86594  ORF Transcript_29243/g.86594 Transcript_29243/m.86594 type:complete len:530 (+) Transcript_29243:750-2339(+)